MNWLFGGGGGETKRTPLQKLQGLHDLAKEALERAYDADQAGQRDAALKLYRTGLEAIQEGLNVQVRWQAIGAGGTGLINGQQVLGVPRL